MATTFRDLMSDQQSAQQFADMLGAAFAKHSAMSPGETTATNTLSKTITQMHRNEQRRTSLLKAQLKIAQAYDKQMKQFTKDVSSKDLVKAQKKLADTINKTISELDNNNQALSDNTRNTEDSNKGILSFNKIIRTKLSGALSKFGIKMDASSHRMKMFETGLATLSYGIKQFDKTLKDSYKYGGITPGGHNLGGQMAYMAKTAFQTGLTPTQVFEQSALHRQQMMAQGGPNALGQYYQMARLNQHQLFGATGSVADATKLNMELMQQLGESGIKPTTKMVQGLDQQFLKMHKAFGMGAEEFAGTVKNLTQDSNVRIKLMTATSEKERAAIVAGTVARYQANRNLGMMAHQAEAAAKAMAHITSMGPEERFKSAARLQAIAGAMGIQGAGRAAQIIMKGNVAPGSKDAAFLQQFLSSMQKQGTSAMYGGGPIGKGMVVERLLGSLPSTLHQMVSAQSPLQTTLTGSMRINQETLKNTATIAQNTGALMTIQQYLEKISATIGPMGGTGAEKMLAGGVMAGAAILKGKSIISAGKGLISAGAKGGEGIFGAAKNMIGSFFSKGGIKSLGAVAEGGLRAATMLKAGVGGILGHFMPAIGHWLGQKLGGQAGGRFGQAAGDVSGGALSGAAMGSLAGPIGTAIGAGVGGLYGLYRSWQDLHATTKKQSDTLTKQQNTSQIHVTNAVSSLNEIQTITTEFSKTLSSVDRKLGILVDLQEKLVQLSDLQLKAYTGSEKDKMQARREGQRLAEIAMGTTHPQLAGH